MASFVLVLLFIIWDTKVFSALAVENNLSECSKAHITQNDTVSVNVQQFFFTKNRLLEDIFEGTEIISLKLNCQSPLPIEWIFTEFLETNSWNVSYTRKAEHLHNSSFFSFSATLEFWDSTAKSVRISSPVCRLISNTCVKVGVNVTSSNGQVTVYPSHDFTEDEEKILKKPIQQTELLFYYDEKRKEFYCFNSIKNSSAVPKIQLKACSNPTECGSYITQENYLPHPEQNTWLEHCEKEDCSSWKVNSSFFHGIAICTYKQENSSNTMKILEYVIDADGVSDSSWDEALGRNLTLEISKDTDYILSGEYFNITCSGAYYVFAKGFHVSIRHSSTNHDSETSTAEFDLTKLNTKNSQHLFVEKIIFANKSFDSSPHISEPVERTITISNFFLPSGSYEVICYAPIWNSTEWVTKSECISVVETSLPVFLDGERDRKLEFEPGQNLTCTAKGQPVPKIVWKIQEMVENQLIYKNVDEFSTGQDKTHSWATVTLPFNMSEVYKNYVCYAENRVGVINKRFHIQRLDVSADLMMKIATLVIVIGFSINLVIIYVVYKYICAKGKIHIPYLS